MKASQFCVLAVMLSLWSQVEAGAYSWRGSTATFYGGPDGKQTMGGACGYGNLYSTGYGLATAAASLDLWNDGLECGTCYEVQCASTKYCKPGVKSVVVTVTNLCPPGGEGWCNRGRQHLDMSQPAYTQVAEYKSGIMSTKMRQVPCIKQGGIVFSLYGNPWFLQVLITNVAGPGNIAEVYIRGDADPWIKMAHNWGQVWNIGKVLVGKSLTFRIHTLRPKQRVTLWYTIPKNWGFGGSYEGNKNFDPKKKRGRRNMDTTVAALPAMSAPEAMIVSPWAPRYPTRFHSAEEEAVESGVQIPAFYSQPVDEDILFDESDDMGFEDDAAADESDVPDQSTSAVDSMNGDLASVQESTATANGNSESLEKPVNGEVATVQEGAASEKPAAVDGNAKSGFAESSKEEASSQGDFVSVGVQRVREALSSLRRRSRQH